MHIAVVVTTYNRPDALAAVLDGYGSQSDLGFELIVADDGSSDDTRALISDYAKRLPFRITLRWQDDRGFRAAAIRNQAVASTTADYVIFTDGDCVPPRHFVGRHRVLAEPGCFIAGNRILLPRVFTERILREHLPIHTWGNARWLAAWFRRDANRLLPLLKFSPNAVFRKARPSRWYGVKTCNLAVWRNDLLRVNGLDERYEGWGLEDSDLVIRLLHAGVRHKSGRFFVPVFHLWHAENDRARLAQNEARLRTLLASSDFRAEQGIDRYLGRGGDTMPAYSTPVHHC